VPIPTLEPGKITIEYPLNESPVVEFVPNHNPPSSLFPIREVLLFSME